MKIYMLPNLESGGNQPNGISRVVEAYYRYLPEYGVEFVPEGQQDLKVVHAGITGPDCDVAILHGLYFTEDYAASRFEFGANATIVHAIRAAKQITVPSHWVSEIFERDLRITPTVVPHGIDWDEWQHNYKPEGYVLYNKNRDGMDVCNSAHVVELASRRRSVPFISTYSKVPLPNIKITGTMPFQEMKPMIQRAEVYLSVTKETFGIGILEAMASGVPVLGFRYGGNVDIVQHGVTGYLAVPNDYDDLAAGLDFCLRNRKILGENSREIAKGWTWKDAVSILYHVFEWASKSEEATVSVIIPTYNYADKVGRAIQSVLDQQWKPEEIIVVDDGSSDNTSAVVKQIIEKNPGRGLMYHYKPNGGVATARNYGFERSHGKYICCLDADDEIDRTFLLKAVQFLEKNPAVYCAYSGILMRLENGKEQVIDWPGQFDYDEQIKHHNQVPTCNLSRRTMWERLGGQRQRYAPMGMGAEDADMWTRMGAYGMAAAKFTDEPLFKYYNSGRTKNREYRETDWLQWHPWVTDKRHPLASFASPEKASHPVRQYDNPLISVIIPVGPGHEREIVNALDSLDAQNFRKWEAVVVWDSPNPIPDIVSDAFPYMRLCFTPKPGSGPGVARNIGVKNARANLILFLDADDWLVPGIALERLYSEWKYSGSIIYSDYYGVSLSDEQSLPSFGNRLVEYNARTREVLSKFKASYYDCSLAQRQPEAKLYHWCLVTCLIPKRFHEQIGGFDETMPSWEDVDYHWRMAQAGICYVYIEEPLVVYQFTTGSRRDKASADSNREVGVSLIEYMQVKYKGVAMSPCPGGCGSGSRSVRPEMRVAGGPPPNISDNDLVMVKLVDGNLGDHAVFGGSTRTNYGYRASGDIFLVKRVDLEVSPFLFQVVNEEGPSDHPVAQPEPPEPQPVAIVSPAAIKADPVVAHPAITVPVISTKPVFDPQTIPGVNERIAKAMLNRHIMSRDEILKMGKEGLMELDGVGEKRAEMILKALEDARSGS